MANVTVSVIMPVYGVEQYSYTVNGVAGKDYSAALTAASKARADS